MKLLLLSMFISCGCFGQVKTIEGSPLLIGSIDTVYHSKYSNGIVLITKKTDTVPCIMLVFDTSLQHYNNFDCINCARTGYDYSVTWQKGYSIYNSYTLRYDYLDADKNPLSKNIIVWISKTINQ